MKTNATMQSLTLLIVNVECVREKASSRNW